MKDLDDFEDLCDIDLTDGGVEEAAVPTPRKNKKGEDSTDYVDNQTLYQNIVAWQEAANDFAVQNEHLIAPYFPDKKDGNSYEKALTAALAAKAIPQEPKVPDTIGVAILHICTKYSLKPNWRSYTWREEMIDDAVMDSVRGIRKFNSVSYTNPFAYFTQVAHWAFTGRISKEKVDHERKMKMAFDPTTDATYSRIDGDTTIYDIGVDGASEFYYANHKE